MKKKPTPKRRHVTMSERRQYEIRQAVSECGSAFEEAVREKLTDLEALAQATSARRMAEMLQRIDALGERVDAAVRGTSKDVAEAFESIDVALGSIDRRLRAIEAWSRTHEGTYAASDLVRVAEASATMPRARRRST